MLIKIKIEFMNATWTILIYFAIASFIRYQFQEFKHELLRFSAEFAVWFVTDIWIKSSASNMYSQKTLES